MLPIFFIYVFDTIYSRKHNVKYCIVDMRINLREIRGIV